jgi:hypothetical protein
LGSTTEDTEERDRAESPESRGIATESGNLTTDDADGTDKTDLMGGFLICALSAISVISGELSTDSVAIPLRFRRFRAIFSSVSLRVLCV